MFINGIGKIQRPVIICQFIIVKEESRVVKGFVYGCGFSTLLLRIRLELTGSGSLTGKGTGNGSFAPLCRIRCRIDQTRIRILGLIKASIPRIQILHIVNIPGLHGGFLLQVHRGHRDTGDTAPLQTRSKWREELMNDAINQSINQCIN